jgi:phenylalanyl-tRNA synthetase beta chain
MKVPYSWLVEMLPDLPAKIDHNPHNLEPILAMLGTGVEEFLESPAPPSGVIFGVVLECQPMIDTHLFELLVDVGDGVPKTIVTGASNARAGVGVAVATPGTQLAAHQSVDMDGQGTVVGIREIQGKTSWGMCCSPKELGIGEYAGGLLELPVNNAAPGTALSSLWAEDVVLDVEITPNRADALSVLGIARDLAAFLKLEVKLPSNGLASQHYANFPVQVEVLEPESCPRFVARMAKGVKVVPSPAWLQRHVTNAGMRAINNLVDASNYVMLELGQPTAAYDVRDLSEQKIVVRHATDAENVISLDDQPRALSAKDLLITTPVNAESRVIGVAGIIGAKYSAITDATTDVVLEAASFNPVQLRLTARRLGLATDAVYRFERGVDPNLPVWAADRYMQLILESGGGEVVSGHFDAGGEQPRLTVKFRPAFANEYLGTNFSSTDQKTALERLGFLVDASSSEVWTVQPSTNRVNMDLEVDLVEEVARMLGYDAIPETLPNIRVNDGVRGVDAPMKATRALKEVLVGLGFQEIVSYSFTNPLEAERARVPAPVLELQNAQTSERTHLRTQLISSLLNTAKINRALESLLLFEVGNVFPYPLSDTNHPGEERLGLLMSGDFAPKTWQAGISGGFYAFKGILEAAAHRLGDSLEVQQHPNAPEFLHPGIAGEIFWNGKSVGMIGALHPQVAANLELPNNTLVAEIRLPLPTRAWNFKDPSRLPSALRDLAIIAPNSTPYSDLEKLTKKAAGLFLENVQPFDVFAGGKIPEGHRSVAIRLEFRAPGRTLTDTEVDGAMQNVMNAMKEAGLEIRG